MLRWSSTFQKRFCYELIGLLTEAHLWHANIFLLIRIYELLIRIYELVFRIYEILIPIYELVIRIYELVIRKYEILIRKYELVKKFCMS